MELGSAQSELVAKTGECDELKTLLAGSSSRADALEREREELLGELAATAEVKGQLSTSLELARAQLTSSSNTMMQLAQQCTDSQQAVAAAQEDREAAREALIAASAQVKLLTAAKLHAEQHIAALTSTCTLFTAELVERSATLVAIQSSLGATHSQLATAQVRLLHGMGCARVPALGCPRFKVQVRCETCLHVAPAGTSGRSRRAEGEVGHRPA